MPEAFGARPRFLRRRRGTWALRDRPSKLVMKTTERDRIRLRETGGNAVAAALPASHQLQLRTAPPLPACIANRWGNNGRRSGEAARSLADTDAAKQSRVRASFEHPAHLVLQNIES